MVSQTMKIHLLLRANCAQSGAELPPGSGVKGSAYICACVGPGTHRINREQILRVHINIFSSKASTQIVHALVLVITSLRYGLVAQCVEAFFVLDPRDFVLDHCQDKK